MGVIVTGHNSPDGFINSEAVTVSNLNSHVNDSTFATSSVDNSSIELTNNNTKLQLKDATSTSTGTTLGKLQYIGSGKVLGRVSANDGIVEQLTLDTDLSTVSASNNELATSKAIKDLVNGMRPKYVDAASGTVNLTQQNVPDGGTRTYNIADFVATGNPSDFDTSKIIGVMVQGFVKCDNAANEILASIPDGTTTRLCRTGGTGTCEVSNTLTIPIEAGQTSLTFTYNSDNTTHNPYTETFLRGFIYQPSL